MNSEDRQTDAKCGPARSKLRFRYILSALMLVAGLCLCGWSLSLSFRINNSVQVVGHDVVVAPIGQGNTPDSWNSIDKYSDPIYESLKTTEDKIHYVNKRVTDLKSTANELAAKQSEPSNRSFPNLSILPKIGWTMLLGVLLCLAGVSLGTIDYMSKIDESKKQAMVIKLREIDDAIKDINTRMAPLRESARSLESIEVLEDNLNKRISNIVEQTFEIKKNHSELDTSGRGNVSPMGNSIRGSVEILASSGKTEYDNALSRVSALAEEFKRIQSSMNTITSDLDQTKTDSEHRIKEIEGLVYNFLPRADFIESLRSNPDEITAQLSLLEGNAALFDDAPAFKANFIECVRRLTAEFDNIRKLKKDEIKFGWLLEPFNLNVFRCPPNKWFEATTMIRLLEVIRIECRDYCIKRCEIFRLIDPKPEEFVDSKEHKTDYYIDVDDPKLNGKVAQTSAIGYLKDKEIIRPALVVVYRYNGEGHPAISETREEPTPSENAGTTIPVTERRVYTEITKETGGLNSPQNRYSTPPVQSASSESEKKDDSN